MLALSGNGLLKQLQSDIGLGLQGMGMLSPSVGRTSSGGIAQSWLEKQNQKNR